LSSATRETAETTLAQRGNSTGTEELTGTEKAVASVTKAGEDITL
jgi:hypothetical protein